MIKTKKTWLAILSFLCALCVGFAIFFGFTSKKVVAESPNISIDFEDATDANGFKALNGSHSVSDGKLNLTQWVYGYYATPISTTGIRVISMDIYIASGSAPTFGFMNASQMGTAEVTTKGSGIYWIQSSATNRRLTSWLNHYTSGALNQDTSDYTDRSSLYNTIHRLEITIVNGTITYSIDASAFISSSKISSALETAGVTLEENVYFCLGEGLGVSGCYIDNFEIKDYLEKGANYAIDFEETADANSFTKFYGNAWSVSNGVYNKPKYTHIYYNTPISTTGTRVISMDFYLASGEKPTFGFMNASQLSTATQTTASSGIYWIQYSTGTKRIASGLNHSTGALMISEEYGSYSYLYGTLHRLEITIVNKSISFAIDGSTFISSSKIASALTTAGITLEDNVYFFMGGDTNVTGTYIDNFEIKDYIPGIPEEDFSLLDKYALTGNVQNNTINYDVDIKDFASGSEMYNYLTTTKAGGTGRAYDLTGAEYISLAVNNQSGINANFKIMLAEGSEVDVNGNATSTAYGRRWSSAIGMPYYLEYADGTVEGSLMTTQSANMAYATVPNGFEGRLVIPTTSFEAVSWSPNSNNNPVFSTDANAISLGYIRFMNIVYYKSGTVDSEGSLIISEPMIYGDYIPAVANSANRVINAINNIGAVTAASEGQIAFAREQYDDLTDKTGVKNYATLETAEAAFAALEDTTYVVATDGKDFTGTGGVAFGEVWSETPSTVSAWIKVAQNTPDGTHIGTIVGNMGRTGSNSVLDTSNSFSFEVTTNGNLKVEWRKSSSAKAVLIAQNVDVRTGAYMHVAFTRNLSAGKLALYVNGVKVAEQAYAWSSLQNLSFINPVMVGSDYTNDEIHALGFTPDFNGFIADVRVYSGVLTEEQIAQDALGSVQDGLMAGVDFISGEASEYYDLVGENATDAFGWKDYSSLEDLKLGDYTFAVIPDTQMLFSLGKDSTGKDLYTAGYNVKDNVLYRNNAWLVENQKALGLKFVMHVGDLTDSLNYDAWATKGAAEMYYAMESMNVLTKAGIPWSMSRGNHDGGNTEARLAYWDNGFTDVTYKDVTYTSTGYNGAEYGVASDRINALTESGALLEFGSMTDENMRNTYYTFAAGNEKWLVVALDLEPTDDVIAWANEIITARADHKTIITTHAYMTSTGAFMSSAMIGGNYGETLWTELASKHSNVVLFLCGHSSGENVVKKQLTGDNGNKVWNFMIDFSQHEFAGNRQTGVFALFGIADNGKTLHVNYLSAIESKLFRSINQFTVSLGELETEAVESKQILDLDGKVALEIATDFTGELPVLERSGHIFLGYLVDGTLYGTYTYTGAETSVQAVFASFTMYNGAATRIGDYGMRFSAYLDMTADELSALGVTISYGTLISPDYAITVDGSKGGVKDYSKMVLESVGNYMINVPSTKQLAANGYTIVNASPTAISLANQLELELVARTYMTVTYADGATATFYAGVTDNGRSIKEVATLALADVSKVKTEEYQYAVTGGYSPYDDTERAYLEEIVG